MTNLSRELTSLQDAKYYLALHESRPDAELLDEVVRSFPEHAQELTEFAIDLALDSIGEPVDPEYATSEETSVAVSRAISRFHNRLYLERRSSEPSSPATSPPANPFASMKREDLRAFAKGIDANLPFVMKLRDRQIDAGTIPRGFTQRVSKHLDLPVELLVAHFQAAPEIRASARFKSDEKPEASLKQSFEEAVRNSGLALEQQEFLLSL
jgi:hypothetical protein